MSLKRTILNVFASCAIASFGAHHALAAEAYPVRPVKLVVAFAPGGVGDVMGRLIAQGLQLKLGGSFYVENKPGADGVIGMSDVIRSQPDGYTLLVGGLGGQIIPPLMRDDFPLDVRNDLTKIAVTGVFPNVVVVNKDIPVNSVRELIDYLKARPGALNFGSSGRLASDRLVAELFMQESGTNMVNVPYKSGGAALNDLMSGSIQVMFPQLPAAIGFIQGGAVKALAVTTRNRLPQLPDVPSLAESAMPGFDVSSWNALYGPKGMPDAIRNALSDAVVAAVNDPTIAERMRAMGAEPVGLKSDTATKFFDDEWVRWKRVVDAGNIKLEK